MWLSLGVGVDLIHALTMVAWLVGFPLLFMHRWPRLRIAYAIFAVGFVVVSQGSMLVLGECVFTTVARWCSSHDPGRAVTNDWFTVRVARAVFGMAPSRHAISRLSEALVLATAVGVIMSFARARPHVADSTP